MTAPFASPPHHPYEKKIYDTVNAMLTDVQTILNKLTLNPNDGNLAPTNGMIGRLQALLQELKNGSPNQTTHDKNIEGILYAIAQICDQFNIFGQSPATPAIRHRREAHMRIASCGSSRRSTRYAAIFSTYSSLGRY